jgi:arginyl-tRNA synthetase
MADPIVELTRLFKEAIARAFGEAYANTDPMLRPSEFADFQANVALGLKKALGGKAPREIAASIVQALEADHCLEKVEIAGPGFINLTLKNEFLASELTRVAGDETLGFTRPERADTVVIDYSSPNIAKEMHVGHLRSTIIGDALARVLTACGHRVIRQNHLGDWGTPFGMLIENLLDGGVGADHSIGDLNDFYRAARVKFDSDPAFAERARKRVVLLQGGDQQTLALWKDLIDASKRYLLRVYELLGIELGEADFAGESLYNPLLADVVDELVQKGIAVESDGAICVFPPGFTGREGKPVPLIVRKQDGGYGYATTDLAAIRYRVQKLGATRLIYVVGTPQSQHFSMAFKAAELAGWLVPPARAEHVNFGSVLGEDGKMFKGRAGETVRLIDLCNEAIERARAPVAERSRDLDADAAERVARAVGIGAVKYADLSSDRIKDYVFSWERMLSLDGNTAPYVQYAHARCRSIMRRAAEPGPFTPIVISNDAERTLARRLLAFPSVVGEVARDLEPHKLCTYLFDLATAYSTFFENCPVLKAETDELRRSRLGLVDVSARVLERGLGLLGIQAPDRM